MMIFGARAFLDQLEGLFATFGTKARVEVVEDVVRLTYVFYVSATTDENRYGASLAYTRVELLADDDYVFYRAAVTVASVRKAVDDRARERIAYNTRTLERTRELERKRG